MTMPCAAEAMEVQVAACPQGVRAALALSRRTLRDWGLDAPAAGSAEIVLAEVLNNIVEHACARAPDGEIALRLSLCGRGVAVCIVDNGAAMPGLRLPDGRHGQRALAAGDLPEGGFGWALIRSLSEDLAYRRECGRNHLSFRLPG